MTISELYELAKNENICITDYDLPYVESYAMMFPETGNCYITMDYKRVSSPADEKSKLAHELGHCVKGAFYNVHSKYDIVSRHEYSADKWAVEHLMPKEDVISAMKSGLVETWQLAEWFGVNERLVKRAMWIYFDKEVS